TPVRRSDSVSNMGLAYSKSRKRRRTKPRRPACDSALDSAGCAEISLQIHLNGGAEGDRTPDLYNAIVALSPLSYGPVPFLFAPWEAREGRPLWAEPRNRKHLYCPPPVVPAEAGTSGRK